MLTYRNLWNSPTLVTFQDRSPPWEEPVGSGIKMKEDRDIRSEGEKIQVKIGLAVESGSLRRKPSYFWTLWKEQKRELCDIRKATLKPLKVQKSKFHIKMSNSEASESNSMPSYYKSKESKEQNSIPTNRESSLPWECFLLKRSKLQPLTNNKKVT